MTSNKPTCPAAKSRVVELYFLEHRAKLIDRDLRGAELGDDQLTESLLEGAHSLVDAHPEGATGLDATVENGNVAVTPPAKDMSGAMGPRVVGADDHDIIADFYFVFFGFFKKIQRCQRPFITRYR